MTEPAVTEPAVTEPAVAEPRQTGLREALRAAEETLCNAGVPAPSWDATELAAHVVGVPRGRLPLVDGLSPEQARAFADLVDRRARRVPLQHLVGTTGFRHLTLACGPGVFVPRPETEVVAQAAIDAVAGLAAPVCVDLCSGSGTLALAVAQEVPAAVVHAVEREADALVWLRRNVEGNGLTVEVHHGDVNDPALLAHLAGRVDLVMSNPPYVAEHERGAVDPEVLHHDPEVALFAGADGLDVVRAVERVAGRLLRPGGTVVVEHSDRQGESAPALFAAAGGWADVADHRDLTGRDRFVTGRRA